MEQTFDSKTRLLDAAELLFGSQGVQATSIRDITSSAQTNLAAVNYHFGSKEGLIAAVLARRAEPVNKERLRLLEAAERAAAPDPVPVEDLIRAFLLPMGEVLTSHPEFMRFASRMVSEPDPQLHGILLHQFAALAQRFHATLQRALPKAHPHNLWLGFGMLVSGTSYLATNRSDMRVIAGILEEPPVSQLIDKLVEFMAAGFRAMEQA